MNGVREVVFYSVIVLAPNKIVGLRFANPTYKNFKLQLISFGRLIKCLKEFVMFVEKTKR